VYWRPWRRLGTIAGLGNADLKLNLSGSGFATFSCTNKGGNTAPGANKVHVSVAPKSLVVPQSSIKNGSVTLPSVGPATVPTPTATAAEAGCPNGNWTATVASIGITDVLLVIEQPPGLRSSIARLVTPAASRTGRPSR
jgi:hypothetical protein